MFLIIHQPLKQEDETYYSKTAVLSICLLENLESLVIKMGWVFLGA